MKHLKFIIIITTFLLFPNVFAHVPLSSSGNESLETATIITDPIKSWAIYAEIHHEGKAHYYRAKMEKDQTLYASLFIPPNDYKRNFRPNMIVIGPEIKSQGNIPPFIEVPIGSSAFLIETKKNIEPSYEPFTPGTLYEISEVRMNITRSNEYYIVIYEPNNEGNYGLAVGYREEFSLTEWLTVPFSTIRIHQWEGQSLGFILTPFLLTFIIGFVLIWRFKRPTSSFSWTNTLASLLFLGSGALQVAQTIIAISESSLSTSVIVTLMFILPSIILGIAIIKISRDEKIGRNKRISIAIIGFLGLIFWSGYIIGPILVFLGVFLPVSSKRT